MQNTSLLTWLTFVPLIGAFIIVCLPKRLEASFKWIALVNSVPQIYLTILMLLKFDGNAAGLQLTHGPFAWIERFHIQYFMGVDSLSVSMVVLTTLICFVAVIASWGIDKHLKGYFSLLLLLNTGMMGTFVAFDFFLFYIFWELMLLPMYFLIGIWGGPRREYAAIKFFLYTLAGSVLILLVMIALYLYSAGNIFDLTRLADVTTHTGRMAITEGLNSFRLFAWLALFVGFAIKVPMFPFHTWLPDAHVEAPTAISVILAGILLKMGTYGMLRFNYAIFPDITLTCAKYIGLFGVINIIYGAFCALAQADFKKLVAYSSISHMGFVMLGMSAFTTEGITGAVMQMFNHGTITAMLFILVGVIYDRAHHREIAKFGGLYSLMPRYAVWVAFAFFAALGLPGLSSFISEVLVFIGSYPTYPTMTIFALTGVILGAVYFLWTIQRAFMGPVNEKYKGLPDINLREVLSLSPLAIIILFLGLYPKPLIDLVDTSLVALNEHVRAAAGF